MSVIPEWEALSGMECGGQHLSLAFWPFCWEPFPCYCDKTNQVSMSSAAVNFHVSRKQIFTCSFHSYPQTVRFSGPFSLLSLEERCPVAASSSSKKRKGRGHALGICDRRPGKRTWGLKRWACPSQSCPCSFCSHSEWAVEILSLAWFYPWKLL